MRTIKTRLGYEFQSDDPTIEVGDKVEVPIPVVEDTVTIPDRVLRYQSQMYGQQKDWNQDTMKEFAAPEGIRSFPEYILKLEEKQLRQFLTRMYGVSATGVRHYSSSTSDIPEIRFRVKHETLARQLQYLWWRLGIRTKPYKNPQIGWLLESAGNAAYVKMRPLMHASKSPKLMKKMRELDRLVPFKFRIEEQPIEDKVVEIVPSPEG